MTADMTAELDFLGSEWACGHSAATCGIDLTAFFDLLATELNRPLTVQETNLVCAGYAEGLADRARWHDDMAALSDQPAPRHERACLPCG